MSPLPPLWISLTILPSLFIIRLLICWLVIKLILRLVKLMHWYHRALITHGTLSATISTRAQPFSRATPDSSEREARGTTLLCNSLFAPMQTPLFINIITYHFNHSCITMTLRRDKCILFANARRKLYLMVTD